jgi:cytochrome c peroxidase
MANRRTGFRDQSVLTAAFFKVALLGSTTLAINAAAAQTAAPASGSESPPAVTEGGFNPHAAPIGRGLAHSSATRGRATPPATAPRYFTKIFDSIFQARLPALIFEEGGVPATVPEREIDLDPTGRVSSLQPLGPTTTGTNAFFQSLGENGRSCVTCHLPPNAMSVSVDNVNTRWNATNGADPIFAPIDGADCPIKVTLADQGSLDPRAAHSLLLDRGLFRIFLAVPDNAEFTAEVVSDPTDTSTHQPPFNNDGCNTDPQFTVGKDGSGNPDQVLSMYRRPRISANLSAVITTRSDRGVNPPAAIDPISGQPVADGTPPVTIDPRTGRPISGNIMWDGREPTLEHQASDATQGHAQAPNPPTSTQVAEMVQFELGIYSAQIWDNRAQLLDAAGGLGGPDYIAGTKPGLPAELVPVPPQTVPIAPPDNATGNAAFPLFDNWATLPAGADRAAQRASVARGEVIFQTRTFTIDAVAGLTNIGAVKPSITGTCSSCHSQVGAGNDVFPAAQHDIGIGGTSPAPGASPPTGSPIALAACNPAPPASTPTPNGCFPPPSATLPIFKLTCNPGKSTVYQGPVVVTNDPGLAMITGLCADIGRFTVPQLRGLAARAPYFSDGSAATLLDVVTFYNNRFQIQFSNQDMEDLIAFLRSL